MEAKSWRCLPSLTGSHHWLVERDNSKQTCKYCKEVRVKKHDTIRTYDIDEWTFTQVPVGDN